MTTGAAAPPWRRVLVLHNPMAGRGGEERLARALAAMRGAGAEVDVHRTERAGDAARRAHECAGYDVVVASGGDGTVNEVVNGLCARTGPTPALAVLPLGTANVLARELGYPRDAEENGRLVASGSIQPIHVAECNGRKFTLMAGAGFDGGVVERTDLWLKRRAGRLAYAVQVVRELMSYDPAPCLVTVDGGEPMEAWSVVVAKGSRYGGRFVLARDADVRSPELHACLFQRRGRLAVLGYIAALAVGQVHRMPGYRVVKGARVTVTGRGSDPAQLDGDKGVRLPLDVRAVDRPIDVVCP